MYILITTHACAGFIFVETNVITPNQIIFLGLFYLVSIFLCSFVLHLNVDGFVLAVVLTIEVILVQRKVLGFFQTTIVQIHLIIGAQEVGV